MLGEIDRDFYCVCDWYTGEGCDAFPNKWSCDNCDNKHRKWPTPEQFKEEYGFEWEGAVYRKCFSVGCSNPCVYREWSDFPWAVKERDCIDTIVKVCACTPWGKPDKDWRP